MSVIVPVFNGAGTIERALDSLAAQTYGSLEILVVDNASTDGTGGVCLAWGDAHPGLMRYARTEVMGVSHARNLALGLARGEYIAFADADDVVLPDFVLTLVETQRQFGCDIAVVGIYTAREGEPTVPKAGSTEEAHEVGLEEAFARTFTTSEIGGFLPNKLFRAEVLEGMAFDEDCSLCEDMLLFFECLAKGATAAYCPEPLYCYVVSPGSASHSLERSRNADGSSKYEQAVTRVMSMFPGRPDLHSAVRARLYKQAVEEKKYFYEIGRGRGNLWIPYVRESLRSNRRSFYEGDFYDARTKARYFLWDVAAPLWALKPLINKFRGNGRLDGR